MLNESLFLKLSNNFRVGSWYALETYLSTGEKMQYLCSDIADCMDYCSDNRNCIFNKKDITFLECLYATVGPAITVESVGANREFWHRTLKNADGSPVRCRANGKVKLWKTRPAEFRLPVKYGLREYFYITPSNAADWTVAP